MSEIKTALTVPKQVKEMNEVERLNDVREFIDDHFRGLFRDVYNIIEISYTQDKEIMGKIKELIGKRIAITNEESVRAIDSLYPDKVGQTLPPVGSRVPSTQE